MDDCSTVLDMQCMAVSCHVISAFEGRIVNLSVGALHFEVLHAFAGQLARVSRGLSQTVRLEPLRLRALKSVFDSTSCT
jgi:hypothetical protein